MDEGEDMLSRCSQIYFLPLWPTKLSGRQKRWLDLVELLRCVIELIKTVRASWKRSSKSSLCWALKDGDGKKRRWFMENSFLCQGEANAPASEFKSPTNYDQRFFIGLLKSLQRVEVNLLDQVNLKQGVWMQLLWALLQNAQESNYSNSGGSGAACWYLTTFIVVW